ncbi:hypothetical protein HBI15_039980 [Parastagonospora nodorum]|nr:hypothetical protein HBI15_039980 [Parastagonospora nodorum]
MNLPGAQRRGTTFYKESAAAQSDTRERKEIENYAKRNSTIFITRDYTTIKLTRLTFLLLSHLADPTLNKAQVILLSQLLTNDRTTLCSTPSEAQKTAPLLVRLSIATTPCRSAARQARIEVTAAYALNYLELQVLKLSKLLQDFVYLRQDPRNFLSANMIALVGIVLYNAIKEYHDDRTRKTIYFHSHTIEDNYNAICEKWKRLSEIRHDYHDNDVDNILIKWKREDNIFTVDECRTSHSNKEDIEADEREEETRVRLRKSSGEIHDILLREFRRANDFTESVTHNDDEQELEPEDCDALVERYEEEINCSDLYSTM